MKNISEVFLTGVTDLDKSHQGAKKHIITRMRNIRQELKRIKGKKHLVIICSK